MEIEELKNKIDFAIRAVNDVPEPFKLKAFEVILSNALRLSPPADRELSSEILQNPSSDIASMDVGIDKLSAITKLNKKQLGDIYHFAEKEPALIAKINGSETEKQIQASLLLLLAMRYFYGQEWVKTSVLSKLLQDYGIGSLQHLAENMEKQVSEILSKGKFRGTEYKLSTQGEQKAIDLLKKYV